MITALMQVALLVKDYDEAIQFYCSILGFQLIEDTLLPQKRWVRIGLAGAQSEILLSRAVGQEQLEQVGRQAAGRVFLFLKTNDLEADYAELCLKGVQFTEEPRLERYGKVAVFKDLYGNRIDLIEPV